MRAAQLFGDHERGQKHGEQRRDDHPVGAGGERHGGEQCHDGQGPRQALCLAEPGGAGDQAAEEERGAAERDERFRPVLDEVKEQLEERRPLLALPHGCG